MINQVKKESHKRFRHEQHFKGKSAEMGIFL
jgi:hypothetical protein